MNNENRQLGCLHPCDSNRINALARVLACAVAYVGFMMIPVDSTNAQSADVQTADAPTETSIRVPIQSFAASSGDQSMMMVQPGYVPTNRTQPADHSYYQKSMFGKWPIAASVDREDPAIKFTLNGPDGKLNVRCEVLINDKPFRAIREAMIDDIIERAQLEDQEMDIEVPVDMPPKKEITVSHGQEPTGEDEVDQASELDSSKPDEDPSADADEEEAIAMSAVAGYQSSAATERLVAYVRSRDDKLSRQELRRRMAELLSGPEVVFATPDIDEDRYDLLPLFVLLDTDADGSISNEESLAAEESITSCDADSNRIITKDELLRGLKTRSPRRTGWEPDRLWSFSISEDQDDEPALEADLTLHVSFGEGAMQPGLTALVAQSLDNKRMIDVRQAGGENASVLLLPLDKSRVAISAVQPSVVADQDDGVGQISIGVAREGYGLLRLIDHNGDSILTTLEIRQCHATLQALDSNADGQVETVEIPTLIRVCVAHTPIAHKVLQNEMTLIQTDRLKTDPAQNHAAEEPEAAPPWFTSMDGNNDSILTSEEFLGKAKLFGTLDADSDGLMTPAEANQADF